MSKPIDWTKPVWTKGSNQPVTILTAEGRGRERVIGYIDDQTEISSWTIDGNYWVRGPDTGFLDLENVPEPPTVREGWVNVYALKNHCGHIVYVDRGTADLYAGKDRVGRNKITLREEYDE
jgi:hypothetical protein